MLVGNAAEGTIGLILSPTGIVVTPVELEPENLIFFFSY